MSKERLEQIKNKKFFDVGNGDLLNLEDVNWLIEQAEKAEKYHETLKNIYELAEYDEYDNTLEQIVSEVEQALEGEE